MVKRFVLVCMLLLVPAIALAQAAISFPSLSYDFGVIGPKDRVVHTFEFVNSGDRDLVIERLAAS